MDLFELGSKMHEYRKRLDELKSHLDIERKEMRIKELEHIAADPTLWDDPDKAKTIQQEQATITHTLNRFKQLDKEVTDGEDGYELAKEDADFIPELEELVPKIEPELRQLEMEQMFTGELDGNAAIVTINSGAGGTESQDWADMLFRMYMRYCERRGYTVEMANLQPADDAGIKAAMFIVRGDWAYGYLQAESGVHRLVRISPFDANARRHTSFAAVNVSPEIDDSIEIDIRDEDLRVDTYRSGGAGGQHINKTDSAVRITHLPTGIVVACQAERSQHKNRHTAMKMLRSRLYELELRKKEEEKVRLAGEKKTIEWGSQIRSYVLHPYKLVKDHRTGYETSNADAVLDGNINDFIETYLMEKSRL